MKRYFVSYRAIAAAAVVLAAAAAGAYGYYRFAPSRQWASKTQWLGASGDETALFFNNQLEEGVQGRYIDGGAYLPLEWVENTLNEKFYWDGEQLIYTLPETIVYMDGQELGSDERPFWVQEENQVWLSVSLVESYTDIRAEEYAEGEAKRIFIDNQWGTQQQAAVKRNGKVRVRGGVKSDILTEVKKGDKVTILETMDRWSCVRTADGYVGYLPNRLLGDLEESERISSFEAPVYTSISMDEPVCLVWHQVMAADANQAMETLISQTKGVNVIAPTWFMLTDNQGGYESFADKEYVDAAHKLGLQVWAVLDNFNKGSQVQSEVLFASTKARQTLISSLMEDVKRYGLDGLNLDIEGIKAEAGPHYVQFIRELSVDCRREGIVLSVDTYVPSAYTAFYNRAEQGRVADYVIIMGYDEHFAGGEPGSVASIGYERKGIEDALEMVPREKLISAIPFYTRVWKTKNGETSSQAMGIAKAKQWVEENQVSLEWQEAVGQYYGEAVVDGADCSIWMEEERSLGLKMDLIRGKGLAGVACWKLGFETPDIWDVVTLP